ncbi:MAG: DUF4097 family beta strand repeat-containing protein [Lysobacterales bacterium]|jgi:DUF4097 and DUF4098 domain-containing protein YvlB
MNTEKLKWTCALLALAPMVALAGQSVDQSWDLDANASVSIDNVAGEVIVRGWSKKEARLTGELGDSVDELELKADKSSLQINVINRNQRSVDETNLVLMVPEGANVSAGGVSADVTVTDLDNRKLTAKTVSGEVDVNATSEWVTVESVSGDVIFDGETPRISAESVSGDIELSGISGQVSASTVSGDVELAAGKLEQARFETVSGDIDAVLEVSADGKLGAESMSGDVTIILPPDQNGLFRAQSFSGRISTDFGVVERARHGPGSHLKFSAGKDGAEIRVESFSGNITLKQH